MQHFPKVMYIAIINNTNPTAGKNKASSDIVEVSVVICAMNQPLLLAN